MIASVGSFNHLPTDQLHSHYLDLMPQIERQARLAFGHLNCPDQRNDKIAECLALAGKWLVRFHKRGVDVNRSPMAFALRVAQAVQSGRNLAGRDRAKDVLSPRAQQRHGFSVTSLPSSTGSRFKESRVQRHQDEFEQLLHESA